MKMINKYEIVLQYIKDLSLEISNAKSFLYSREHITKYVLGIDITTDTLKNNMVEVITKLTHKDPNDKIKNSYFEISYSTVIKIKDKNIKKPDLEKLLLCDLQKEVYPKIEKIFINLMKDAGFPELKLDKKVDFDQLYQQRLN